MFKNLKVFNRWAFALSLVIAPIASFGASWYTVTVYTITPATDSGDVIVQFKPTAGEARFTVPVVTGLLPGSEPGSNKQMATILSAVALGLPITIRTEGLPTDWPPQVIDRASLVVNR